MRVYEKFEEVEFRYPKQMAAILAYLREHGELKITARTVERLYREFSETSCASWLSVGPETLEDFADRLNEYDL